MTKKIIQKLRRNIAGLFLLRRFRGKRDLPHSHNEVSDDEKAGSLVPGKHKEGEATSDLKKEPTHAETEAAQRGGRRKREKKTWKPSDYQVDCVPGKVRFHDIGLPDRVLRAIADMRFEYCTPVQEKSLPHLLEKKDVIGNANTGTGKTAVFLITILTRLIREKHTKRGVKALIIAPTRELVIQIARDGRKFAKYTGFSVVSVYGGADYIKQQEILEKRKGDIIIATPGRLLDFCKRKLINLQTCSMLVIDEADRMLDMGFIPDVRKIIHELPAKDLRQTLMFSATITDEVKKLASHWCNHSVNISIDTEQVAVDSVEQLFYLVSGTEKFAVVYNIIHRNREKKIAVFANQKSEAKKLADRLKRSGIQCTLLTGDVPQKKRMSRLESFRSGKVKVLVATDVAGRGIHIEGISHVINYSLPYEPEDYVHRIGRTGRAGEAGVSVGFACEEGGFIVPEIESFTGRKIDCILPDDDLLIKPPKKEIHQKNSVQPKGKRRRKKNSRG